MRVWILQPHEHTPLDTGWDPIRTAPLARELVDGGAHDVTWWTSRFHHHSRSFRTHRAGAVPLDDGYSLMLLDGPGYRRPRSLRRLRHYRCLARAFVQHANDADRLPDLLHCVVPPLELAEAGVRWACRHGIPVTVDVMDLWPDVYLTAVPAPLRAAARPLLRNEFTRLRRICSAAVAITAISPDYLNWGLRHAGRARGRLDAVFPLGATPPAASPVRPTALDDAALGRFHDRFVATFAGSFISMCDIGVILEAAALLARGGRDDLTFVVAGDGPRAARWRRRAAGQPNVLLPGWLTGDRLTWLLNNSHVGLASYVPGAPMSWPNKLWTYLAHGLPVIASLGGATRELLRTEDVGLAVPAGDAAALARAVEQLAGDPAGRARMAERAGAVFRARFCAERIYADMARHLRDVYRDAAGRQAGQPGGDAFPSRSS